MNITRVSVERGLRMEGNKKDYCTQNNGDCSTCSLVSYGRDCRNNPVEEIETGTNPIRTRTDIQPLYKRGTE